MGSERVLRRRLHRQAQLQQLQEQSRQVVKESLISADASLSVVAGPSCKIFVLVNVVLYCLLLLLLLLLREDLRGKGKSGLTARRVPTTQVSIGSAAAAASRRLSNGGGGSSGLEGY